MLALVEAVSVLARLAGLEREPARPAIPRPLLGRVEQLLADAQRAPLRMHGEVFDPYAATEADRLDVLVGSAEADKLIIEARHEESGTVGRQEAADHCHRLVVTPAGRSDPRRREQPLVHP